MRWSLIFWHVRRAWQRAENSSELLCEDKAGACCLCGAVRWWGSMCEHPGALCTKDNEEKQALKAVQTYRAMRFVVACGCICLVCAALLVCM